MSDREDSPDKQNGFTNLSIEGFSALIDDDTQLSALGETQEPDTAEDPCYEASESDSDERKRGWRTDGRRPPGSDSLVSVVLPQDKTRAKAHDKHARDLAESIILE